MKTISTIQVLHAIRMVSAILAGSASLSAAIPLAWVDGPESGQPFFGGPIQIKAVNYETSTLYNPIPISTSIGYSGSGPGVAGGEATLNAPGNVSRPALNGRPGEDSWGILKITNIQSTASNGVLHDVYNAATSPFELTGMMHGIRDFFIAQVSAGSGLPSSGQIVAGTGMRLDIYMDSSKDFSQVAGPAGRTGVADFTSVTNGTLELSLLSTPGFISANGTLGGAATEHERNTANVSYAALNVIGGASAARFNTNRIGFGGSSGAGFMPGLAAQAATDVWFSFTSTSGANGWDITSNDPMLAQLTKVPDSGSTLLLFVGALALLPAARRRVSGLR